MWWQHFGYFLYYAASKKCSIFLVNLLLSLQLIPSASFKTFVKFVWAHKRSSVSSICKNDQNCFSGNFNQESLDKKITECIKIPFLESLKLKCRNKRSFWWQIFFRFNDLLSALLLTQSIKACNTIEVWED